MHLRRSVHNSRKNQLYVYLACLREQAFRFHALWLLCNVRSNFTEENFKELFNVRSQSIFFKHTQYWNKYGISVPPVQYMQGIVRAGGCQVVVGQWQSTGCTPSVLGSIPGHCQPFHFPVFSPRNSLYSNVNIDHSQFKMSLICSRALSQQYVM